MVEIKTKIKYGLAILLLAGLVVGLALRPVPLPSPGGGWVETPAGFSLTACEVTVGDFAAYLNAVHPVPIYGSPQISCDGKKYRVRVSTLMPVAFVSVLDAQAYAAWYGYQKNKPVYLPDASLWEQAAMADVSGAPFPWGWGSPTGRAVWGVSGARVVGTCPPNGWGLYDMAGNLAEWCRLGTGWVVKGGNWADRDANALKTKANITMHSGYRDADVGFRLMMENNNAAEKMYDEYQAYP